MILNFHESEFSPCWKCACFYDSIYKMLNFNDAKNLRCSIPIRWSEQDFYETCSNMSEKFFFSEWEKILSVMFKKYFLSPLFYLPSSWHSLHFMSPRIWPHCVHIKQRSTHLTLEWGSGKHVNRDMFFLVFLN